MSSAAATFVLNALWQTTLLAAAGLALGRRRWGIAVTAFVMACVVPLIAARTQTGVSVPHQNAQRVEQALLSARDAAGIAVGEAILIAIAAIRHARRWWKARRILQGARSMNGLLVADVPTPIVAGILRPRIVIPEYLLGDERLLAAALAHERAHIARRDPLLDFLLELLALPVAFHPALVLLRRRIHELREICCDEIAAGATGGREYAQALIAIARLAAPSPALAMAEKTSIERRIAALRDERPQHRGLPLIAIVALTLIATVSCRYAVKPHIGSDLSGTWVLDLKASRAKNVRALTQTIRQNGNHVAVTQNRQTARGPRRVSWHVEADGKPRPFPGIARSTSVAVWVDEKLVLDIRAPHQTERATAWLEGPNAMVIVGEYANRTGSGSYHSVFRRQQ